MNLMIYHADILINTEVEEQYNFFHLLVKQKQIYIQIL
jgi:hypothetical protein